MRIADVAAPGRVVWCADRTRDVWLGEGGGECPRASRPVRSAPRRTAGTRYWDMPFEGSDAQPWEGARNSAHRHRYRPFSVMNVNSPVSCDVRFRWARSPDPRPESIRRSEARQG